MNYTYINKHGKEVSAIGKNKKFKTSAVKYYKKHNIAPNGYYFNEKGHLREISDGDQIKVYDIRQMSKQDFTTSYKWMGFNTKQSLFKYIKDKKIKTHTQLLERLGEEHDEASKKISTSLRKLFFKNKFKDLFKHTTVIGTAFKGYNKHFNITDGKDYKSSEAFWKAYARRVRVILLHFGFPLDVNAFINVRLVHAESGTIQNATYSIGKYTILNDMSIDNIIDKFIDKTTTTTQTEDNHENDESKQKEGTDSDLVLDAITGLKLLLNKKVKKSGGKTMTLPQWLVKKVVNPRNNDDECILHCINYFEHNHLVNSNGQRRYELNRFQKFYHKYDELREKLEFPVSIRNIHKIEAYLKLNIVVYNLDLSKSSKNTNICPLYANDKKYDRTVYLMLVQDRENSHYVWVQDKERLFAHMKKHKEKMIRCDKCFQFIAPSKFDTHSCVENPTIIKFPKERELLRFKGIYKQLFQEFVCYADKETLAMMTELSKSKNQNPKKNKQRHTQTHAQHIPCSFMYVIVRNGKVFKSRSYRGENSVRVFLDTIQQDYLDIYENYLMKKLEMTDVDWDEYNSSKRCKLCDVEFSDVKQYEPKKHITDDVYRQILSKIVNDKRYILYIDSNRKLSQSCKVPKSVLIEFKDYFWNTIPKDALNRRKCRDHCHITGKYRQALCNNCNIHYCVKKYLPVFFHNLKGYDGHFIISELKPTDMKFDGIATNSENMSLFSLKGDKGKEICFRDSFSFLPTSLDELSQITPDDRFILLEQYCKKEYPEKHQDALLLLRNKGAYPYDYMDDFDKFNDTTLPPIEFFASKMKYHNKSFHQLNDEQRDHVKKQYERAWKIWNFFECKNLGDFHDIYLTSDVYILADVFENSRQHCLTNYGLDPVHYFSGAQLYFDSMIKEMKDDVNILCEDDRELYELFERGINGGISMIPHRYSKANNKYLTDYNPKLPDIFLLYIDANSLYPHAMKEKLPCDDFEFLDISNFSTQDIIELVKNDDGDKGFLVSFKLDVLPHRFQDYTRYLPFFPQKTRIDSSHLNPFQTKIQQILQGTENIKHSSVKLCPHFWKKDEVICHSKNLNLFLRIAERLDCLDEIKSKIEFISVIHFTQKQVFRDSIIKRQNLRKDATTDFEKQFHKNSMNMPFGKTFEDVKKRRDYTISHDGKHNEKMANNPRMLSFKIINEDCVLYHNLKKSITLNKPIFLGWAILELSKYHMYKTFYDVFVPKYHDKIKVCLMDTDSFIFEIQTHDLYKDLRELDDEHSFMDWSNYPITHPVFEGLCKDDILAKVKTDNITGLFKDESKGLVMYEYSGLRAKTYSYSIANEDLLVNKNMIGLNHLGKTNYNPSKLSVVKSKGCSNKNTHKEYADMVLFFRNSQNIEPTKDMLMKFKESLQFRSFDHKVFTQLLNKTTLTNFDDKFSTCPDGIHNFPHGHYKVIEYSQGLRFWNNETHDYQLI
jgi:hypothetical protein